MSSSKETESVQNMPPPSRSLSHVSAPFSEKGKSKYTFGKYLKLDEDALRHF